MTNARIIGIMIFCTLFLLPIEVVKPPKFMLCYFHRDDPMDKVKKTHDETSSGNHPI
jgi:hypothetical protein